jgi:hypothetical protein
MHLDCLGSRHFCIEVTFMWTLQRRAARVVEIMGQTEGSYAEIDAKLDLWFANHTGCWNWLNANGLQPSRPVHFHVALQRLFVDYPLVQPVSVRVFEPTL